MNCLIKILTALLPAIVVFPLSGCGSRPDYTLAPPADAERVTVAVTLPPETEVLPLDVLYRSETCRKEVYDNTSASHVTTVRGVNPRLVSLGQTDSAGRREAKIAINGGGKCGWRLSAIRVDIQLKGDVPLAAGKHIIPTSYVFGFDDEAYGSGEGSGRKREAHGDLLLETELFPMITYHRDHEVTVKLFGGDPDYDKWSRHYRLYGSRQITINPLLHLTKTVTITPPNPAPGDLIATYSDGSIGKVRDIYPDYNKLLLMK